MTLGFRKPALWHAIALLALAASCLLASTRVDAATSSTVVGATVPTSTTIALSGCAGPPELQLGSLAVGTTSLTSPCHVDFGANAPATLRMFQKDRTGAAMTQVRTTLDTRSGVPSYRAVDVVSSSIVWVAGTRVNAGDVTPLRVTTNGGSSWTDVTPCAAVGSGIGHLVAWSASEVLIVSSNKACYSSDTGATWTSVTTPYAFNARLANPTGDILWATTTTTGRIMRSADRGLTWTSFLIPGATTSPYNLVAWGASDVVAIGTVTAGDNLSRTAYAWRTTDTGTTWTQSTIGTIPVTTVPATTGSMALIDRSSVSGRIIASGSWALGNQFKQYYSDDGGATWTATALHPFTDRLRYLGGSTWMGGNRMDTAYVSTNDGASWGTVAMGGGPTAFFNGISRVQGGAVVAIGDASTVLMSTNSAASWTSISPAYTSYFAVVSFNANDIAIVAADGSALRSSDAGATLVPATGCGGSTYTDAVATGPTSAIAVGSAGWICRTTDKGATWTQVPSGTGTWFTEVIRIPRTGVLIAHGSTTAQFYRSTDDGLTWSAMSLGIAGNAGVTAVDEDGSTMVIGKASNGLMWVSTDFGATWSSRDDGMASSLQSVAVSPSGARILGGHYPIPGDNLNRVTTSTDNGATWTSAMVNAGSGEVLGLTFTSELRVWALAGNKVHVSDDSGATFATVATSAGSATELEVLDANTVLTSGLGKLLAVSRPTTALPDVVAGTGLTPAGGAFGACLLGTTNAANSWPVTGTCTVADPVPWRPAAADSTAPGSILATSTGGTSAADLVFGLRVGPTQSAGAYAAHVVFEVVAP
ncbi:MAG: bnr asp-box repeat-containing protein [Thermoleophilia bacterium]|nr:bnr asp-box repeat-containing protein [Thermoleophilia bacterium]